MKHRDAALLVMKSINDIEDVFEKLMSDLFSLRGLVQVTDDEFELVTSTVVSTLRKLEAELVDAITKEHPDLAPKCRECSACKSCHSDIPED